MQDSNTSPKPSMAKALRYVTFLVTVMGLAVVSIFFTFKGLTSPKAMEQAQIGREIARGNGYSTKAIHPVAIWQMEKNNKELGSFKNFPDSYHAPLNPLIYSGVLKAVGGDHSEKWAMSKSSNIYELDRILAAVCVLFFLVSIGTNYLLISRIFDSTIAGVTALLMVFCELMWSFSQSGLPQMLMLMLFSFAMLHLWKAVEKSEEGVNSLGSILIAGVFMSLLVLTHWITIWIFIGFTIFAAVYFKPRGVIAGLLLGMLLLFTIPVIYLLYMLPTGSPLGIAKFVIHDGLGYSQDYILRSLEPENQELQLNGLILTILSSSLRQIAQIHENLGSIVVAPLFFIALLHPFKKAKLRSFRWFILLMWILASIGITIYGSKGGVMGPNQIIILFAPLMTAYGLAIVSVLWARLDIPQSMQVLKYSHFIIIIFISIGPMMLSLPKTLKIGLATGKVGSAVLPNYFPRSFNERLGQNTTVNDTIISDIPWAVAWYADRICISLPQDMRQIEQVETMALKHQNPVAGVLITPYSYNSQPIINTGGRGGVYKDLFPLIYGGWSAYGFANNFVKTHPKFKSFSQRYPNSQDIFYGNYMMYYSKNPLAATVD